MFKTSKTNVYLAIICRVLIILTGIILHQYLVRHPKDYYANTLKDSLRRATKDLVEAMK